MLNSLSGSLCVPMAAGTAHSLTPTLLLGIFAVSFIHSTSPNISQCIHHAPICRTATSICTQQHVLTPPVFTTRASRDQSPAVCVAMAKTPLALVVELVWVHDGAPSRLLSLFDWEHASKDVTCQQSTCRTSAPYRCIHRDPTDACTLNCPRRSDGAFVP